MLLIRERGTESMRSSSAELWLIFLFEWLPYCLAEGGGITSCCAILMELTDVVCPSRSQIDVHGPNRAAKAAVL